MISPLPPAAVFILGALLIPFFKGHLRRIVMLALPVLAFINLIHLPLGDSWVVPFLGQELVLARIDRLSLVFGYIFILIGLISTIYALHVEETLQNVAGALYTGSALGVVFAGDFFSFFIFWELLTVFCVQLIWARRTRLSMGAGYRYLLFHAAGGLILLAGIVLRVHHTGSIEFGLIGLNGPGTLLIFLGLGINCAWPFVHTWLSDAYPEATITGTIFLSAFTTKAAVYALARAYPGTEALIYIGAAMAGFPIFFAVIENDLRRVLAYSLINQVGFMVCGIGIGTQLAINGAVAHAFNDVLFKGLLFMTMGAVMYRTGKINATDIGGLYRTMPLTCIFCIIGAASISAFPLFSGFVSKSMVMDAAGGEHLRLVWFILLFASAGVFHHAGIKIPLFRIFLARFRPKAERSADSYAGGHGLGRVPVYFHRVVPAVFIQHFTLPARRLRTLHRTPCSRANPDPVFFGPGVCPPAALRHLSGRDSLCQSGYRLVLPKGRRPCTGWWIPFSTT